MASEILLHVNENLDEAKREQLLDLLSEVSGEARAETHSNKPHLLFVRYNQEKSSPDALVAAAARAGVTAQIVDL